MPTFPCFASIVTSLMEKVSKIYLFSSLCLLSFGLWSVSKVIYIMTVLLTMQPHIDFGMNVLGCDIMSIPGLYRPVQVPLSVIFLVRTLNKRNCNWSTSHTILSGHCHKAGCKFISLATNFWDTHPWCFIVSLSFYIWLLLHESFFYIYIRRFSISLCIFICLNRVAIKKPVGILHVKVVRAIKLLKMDILGTSDPYVKLSLSGERLPSKKTTIKKRNLNPEWNENFKLLVKDPQSQILNINVFDWDKVCLLNFCRCFLILVNRNTKAVNLNISKN